MDLVHATILAQGVNLEGRSTLGREVGEMMALPCLHKHPYDDSVEPRNLRHSFPIILGRRGRIPLSRSMCERRSGEFLVGFGTWNLDKTREMPWPFLRLLIPDTGAHY